jgi:hypothetical protein
MSTQARPNLGGLFDGSTPADRTSGIAGRLGPRLVTAPVGLPANTATPAWSKVEPTPDAEESTDPTEASRGSGSAQRPIDPSAWLDPIRALEMYFGVLQAMLDANRQFVMGVAGVLVSGGTRLRGGLDSIRNKP